MQRLSSHTSPRRRDPLELDQVIAAVLREGDKPVSAYEIIDMLDARGERLGAQQVYRVLKRLQADGAARRIESLNAYCAGRESEYAIQYCSECGAYVMLPILDVAGALEDWASSMGFRLKRKVIELAGRCEECDDLRKPRSKSQ